MTTPDSASLSEQFAIPGEVHFTKLDGLDVIEISNAHGSGRILLQGALLLDWTPKDELPLIWVSPKAKFIPGKAPRGGVPVCWPWFGAHVSDTALPAHGIARAARWDILEVRSHDASGHRIVFQLHGHDSNQSFWPQNTPLLISYTLGKSIEIELITRNDETHPVTITEALHTYFAVSDIRNITIVGLDGVTYTDKVDKGLRKQQDGNIGFSGETDRVYMDTTGDCVIQDPGFHRSIRVEKRESQSTIIWNPWIEKAASMGDYTEDGYLRMVCVESGNAVDNRVTVEPGGEHRLWVRYSTAPLG